ncbi:MAG: hypothetical protein ACM3TR_02450 [Caulobacteraceae bacterium]
MDKIIACCGLDCSKCGDYSCDRLNDFFKAAPDAKANLDNLR